MKDIFAYSEAIKVMRKFFQEKKGFIEVPAQSRKSILAACEDPATISQYIFSGENWPLPQTGQMWLERELLKYPEVKGVFCITTSYRNEPNPIPGRHDKIFPMFEFESHGDINDLIDLETELIFDMGFGSKLEKATYNDVCDRYNVSELTAKHEELMRDDYGNITFLTEFPQRTHPFWNMKHKVDDIYSKVDVIMFGMETIGSAERSCNVDEMRKQFYTISDGEYATLLFNHFGRKRVEDELEEYFSLDMFERFGGGIGVTRMVRAMKESNIL